MIAKGGVPRLVVAAGWMAGALIAFIAMMVAARELSDTMHTFEILLFRSIVGLAIVGVLVLRAGKAVLRTTRPRLHVIRNVLHFAGQYGWIYGIAVLPLAEVTAIEFTAPIWTAVLAVLFLGERMNRGRVVAIGLGFAGIFVILRPGVEVVQLASLVVLASAICYATTHVTTKALTATDRPLTILFYMMVVQLPIGLVLSPLVWTPPVAADVPWLLLVGAAALVAHYCLARAFQLADATVAVPMDFIRLPLTAFVGYLLYAERFELAILAGAVLIFAGNYYSIRRESRLETADAAEAKSPTPD
jgi:drug/metabolite transporter (DMT)-like permease